MFRLSSVILLLVSFLFSRASTYEDIYDVMFDESDFEYYYDDYGFFHIDPKDKSYIYPEGLAPELPLFPIDIAIKGGRKYVNSAAICWRKCIYNNVLMPNAPGPLETDDLLSEQATDTPSLNYLGGLYPQNQCEYVGCTEWDDVVILHFMVCPFSYDDSYRSLYFMKDFQIYVETEDIEMSEPKKSKREFAFGKPVIKSMVLNSADVDKLELKEKLIEESQERVDYLIVTKESLREAFTPLIQWKKKKGLYSKIVSIEDIEANYSGETTQLKIKKCLYDLYSNNGLKYVLLGGDDTVVPVQLCFCCESNVQNPSDMFYACFGGDFDWDTNRNGILGEKKDNVSYAQDIYVSRLPIRSAINVYDFVCRLIGYETQPNWSNSMLVCANQMYTNKDIADKQNKYYNKYIEPYWKGDTKRFYDTYTDFPNGANYDLNEENFTEQLSKGYTFVNFFTHGGYNKWKLENGAFYYVSHAKEQNNIGYTLLTTRACNTNWFDREDDPCLSEALIRNPNSGVIGFYGTSRANWDYASELFESAFYKYLLSEGMRTNFAVVVASSKLSQVASCLYDETCRSTILGLNAIGDPEMQIFIAEPLKFDDVKFSNLAGKGLDMDVGVDSCRICVMSAEDFGDTFYMVFDDVNNVSLDNLPVKCNVCITKQGYIPKQYSVCHIQNEEINESKSFEYDIIKVGARITGYKEQSPVFILSGSSTMTGKVVVFDSDVYIGENAELLIK